MSTFEISALKKDNPEIGKGFFLTCRGPDVTFEGIVDDIIHETDDSFTLKGTITSRMIFSNVINGLVYE